VPGATRRLIAPTAWPVWTTRDLPVDPAPGDRPVDRTVRGPCGLIEPSVRPAGARRYRHGVDRRFLRPGWIVGHVLVFLAFLICLRLGWWQWDRTHDADGTAQNLGYALLWPAFGAAFIYMWVRFLDLEVLKDTEDEEETERDLQTLLAEGDDSAGTSGEQQLDEQDRSEPAGEPSGNQQFQDDVELAAVDAGESDEPEELPELPTGRRGRRPDLQRPSRAVTISVAMVGEDDDDDPELAAYNQALAALAEEDRRRAR
jgi:hypothetical protein